MTAAALLGGLAPDLSLYLMAGWHLMVLGTDAEIVFRQLYYSDRWQAIFAVDNSFILWGIGLAIAVSARSAWAVALTGSALLHLALDFPLHHDDARRHFWPITDWVFESPISYWDPAHYGGIVGLIEAALVVVLLVVLWRRFQGAVARSVIVASGTLQVAPAIIWAFVFSS